MDNNESMLSTTDNPYNPWSEFDDWNRWDCSHGYNTLAYLGRLTRTSDDLSEPDQSVAYEQAIDEVVDNNGGLYIKVPCPATPLPIAD